MKKRIVYTLILVIALFIGSDYLDVLEFDLGSILQSDREAPVIHTDQLKTKVVKGSPYSLEDVYCTDNLDDTCTVKIDGDVNTSSLGTYLIVFRATDSLGNEIEITFTVEVIEFIDPSVYIPDGYYLNIEGLTGEDLKSALNDIITSHIEYPYTDDETDVWDILRAADEDPENPDNVLLFYTGVSWPKACQDTITPPDYCEAEMYGELRTIEWNREHIWSKSRGGFTNDSDLGAYTDTHHLVAAERRMNSIKNNRLFEDCHDGDDTNIEDRGYGNYTCNDWEFEPRDEVKGDVARMLFYMAVRYEGETGDLVDLELADDPDASRDSFLPLYGDIDDLLRWHLEDPVREEEILRNEVIFSYQGNRNPFIDMPELAELIWGSPEDYN
ncbi:MAG: endonuclease [Candidatus Izimaplasma sp.]|nr:endonuclease [Candidatus Izimaplasma bacterium]